MTHLICSIPVVDESALPDLVERAWTQGASAIELRLDQYQGSITTINNFLIDHKEKTWIVTCRSIHEGGHSVKPPAERIELLTTAVKDTCAFIDFELEDWDKQFAAISLDQHNGHRIIFSNHHFNGCPSDVNAFPARTQAEHNNAITKIAYTSKHINGTFAALDLMHQHADQVIAIAMGDCGTWTRILARKLGAFGTFCALDPDHQTAPGQVNINDMISHYRWHSINASTKVFGVIGDPVAHSMSPLLFNHWFAEAGINAVYLPLHVSNVPNALPQFLDQCAKRPWLSISGLSVTVPHKQAALTYVTQKADRVAQSIGAANTIVFDDQQNARACNTDCHAAIDSLTAALRCDHKDLANFSVDILGAGGSARAIVAGLRSYACDMTIYSRKDEPAKRLAAQFQAQSQPWSQRGTRMARILINCTPVGMWPSIQDSPMSPDALKHYELVFDLIYRPWQTKLLLDARAQGKTTLNGLDMFVRQAAAQFQLWTGQEADTALAYQLIENELTREPPT